MHVKDRDKENSTREMDADPEARQQTINIRNIRIYKLDPELANQIAAGEVVERPASVLKELLENSLDAGSSQIDISIERGGLGLIRVQDNGHGICKDDLELALSQHATSKILSFADLEGVASFGFRGEALASISAVARLNLSSCVKGQASGFSIQKAGRNAHIQLSLSPPTLGTTVEVRELFYNTPARRKFLRSERTESLYIDECFKRIALSQPAVSFTLRVDSKPPKRLVACKTLEAESRRVAELCGSTFIKTAHYIEAESNGLKIRGWLGSPTQTRAQADLQYFYVNGRSIRDKVVNYALRQAYQEYQVGGRHPSYVLFFELDPEAVDVNVHPTKHEVRFREVRAVTAFLIYSVRQALGEAMVSAMGTILPGTDTESLAGGQTDGLSENLLYGLVKDDNYKENNFDKSQDLESHITQPVAYQLLTKTQNSILIAEINSQTQETPEQWIHRVLTIIGNEFLVGENSEGLVLLDIKALVKAKTEQVMTKALLVSNSEIASRPLLMPFRIELKDLEKNNTLEHAKINFAQLGFSWSQIGPNSVLIRQVPFVINTIANDFEPFLEKLISLPEQEQAIAWIAEYVAKHEKLDLSEEKISKFLQDVQMVLQNQHNEGKFKSDKSLKSIYYRQLTLLDFKKIFAS